MPPVTIGVFSNEPSLAMPVWKIMRGISCETFEVLMVLSCEYRWFQSLPPYVVQSPPWAAAGPAAARSTGTTSQRVLMRMDTLPFELDLRIGDGPWLARGRSKREPLRPILQPSGGSSAADARHRPFERGTGAPFPPTREERRAGSRQHCGEASVPWGSRPSGRRRKGALSVEP